MSPNPQSSNHILTIRKKCLQNKYCHGYKMCRERNTTQQSEGSKGHQEEQGRGGEGAALKDKQARGWEANAGKTEDRQKTDGSE